MAGCGELEDVELQLQRDVLQTLHYYLVHGIRAVDVCSKLFTVGLLTERERSDILAQANHSPDDATETIVSALRHLHKGKETLSVLCCALKEICGYQGIAERIARQAFQNAERPASQAESEDLPLPQLATTDNDSFSGITLSQSQVTNHEIVSPERQSINHVHSPPVPGEVPPTLPEFVYLPSGVEDLNTGFGHLLLQAYETVCALPPGRLGGLRRSLSTILKPNPFDNGFNIEKRPEDMAELVTNPDQDFVNHRCLSKCIEMLRDPDLLKMHKEYEAKLKDQKTKSIYNRHIESLPKRIDLTFDVKVEAMLRMGHKEKLPEEFQLDHVITELNFLNKFTRTTEVKFKGFSTERGNVVSPAGVRRSTGTSESRVCTESCSLLYLYFSLPQQAARHLYRDNIPTLLGSMRSFAAAGHLMCGVTNVTVYGSRYCTFDLPT